MIFERLLHHSPDFFITSHLFSKAWDGIKRAITQVATALMVMPASEGYIFVAIAHPSNGQRYRIELVRLAI